MTVTSDLRGRAGARSGMSGSPLPTRERRPGYIALAIALIVGFAALGLYLYEQAGAKTPIIVVVADLPEGHTIQRSDLSTAAVAGGITAIAAGNLDSVVGQTARVHLLPNTVLQRSMVTTASPLARGQAQVGVAVKSGQIPADGLQPGDVVQVVQVPAAGAASGAGARSTQVLVDQAVVFVSRDDPAQTGTTLLTLVVPLPSSTIVAAASATGQIALVKVARS